jgi:hypothetical protein
LENRMDADASEVIDYELQNGPQSSGKLLE